MLYTSDHRVQAGLGHSGVCVWMDSHLVGVDPDRNTKGPGKAEVRQFDDPLVVDKEVLGFQVPVEDSTTVTEKNTFQDLVQVALKGRWWNGRVNI